LHYTEETELCVLELVGMAAKQACAHLKSTVGNTLTYSLPLSLVPRLDEDSRQDLEAWSGALVMLHGASLVTVSSPQMDNAVLARALLGSMAEGATVEEAFFLQKYVFTKMISCIPM
jgi:hypothetical protein